MELRKYFKISYWQCCKWPLKTVASSLGFRKVSGQFKIKYQLYFIQLFQGGKCFFLLCYVNFHWNLLGTMGIVFFLVIIDQTSTKIIKFGKNLITMMHSCVTYLINVIYSPLKVIRQAVLYFHCIHCRKINGGLERVKDVIESLNVFNRTEAGTWIWLQGCIFSSTLYCDPMNRQRLFSMYLLQKTYRKDWNVSACYNGSVFSFS